MNFNIVQKNLIRHLSLLSVTEKVSINCKAVLIDRHGNDASIKYNCNIEIFLRNDDIVVNILEKDLKIIPYSTEFIVKVSIYDDYDHEIAWLEAGFVMHSGDTVTLNPTAPRPPDAADIVREKIPETLTEKSIKDIDELPDLGDLSEWPSIIK